MGWRLTALSDRGPECGGHPATNVLLLATLLLQGCGSMSVDVDDLVGTGGVTSSGGSASGGMTGSGGATGGITGSGASSGSGGETNPADDYEVLVDPYGNAALVAVVNVPGLEASDVATVAVVVNGQNGAPDLARSYVPTESSFVDQLDSSDLMFDQAGLHVPVLGLYADVESSVTILVDLLDGSQLDLTVPIETQLTDPSEEPWVPSIRIDAANVDQMEPGWTVAEISIEPNPAPPVVIVNWTRTVAFDERGALRWALSLDLPAGETFTTTRSLAGNFLTGSFDTIVEVTKLGRVIHSLQVTGYSLHHEILQIGSDDAGHASSAASEHVGKLLVLASKEGGSTIQDHILEVDAGTGEVLHDWDLATVLDTTRTTYVDPEQWAPGAGDWLHANGLAYSSADESIIVSGRHQGVAKIDREGNLLWLLAPHEGWLEPQSEKLLTAVDAALNPYGEPVQLGSEAAGNATSPEFGWPFGQHSPVLLPSGDLLLFDNGSSRHFGPVCGGFSRAVVYRIDEVELTVRQLGQFILSSAQSSCFVSSAHWLPGTGNLFVQPGGQYFDTGSNTAVAKEVATEVAADGTVTFGTVVFDATLDMNVIPANYFAYSYRGHRWVF